MTKRGTRRLCPICAAASKADARRCEACGSTLVGLELAWETAPPPRPAKAGAPAPDAPGEVGVRGVTTVAGALVAYGAGAWLDPLGQGLHALLALAGALAGWQLGRQLDGPGAPSK